jgi:fido (protein-threonine AMPylation protein)
MVLGTLPLAQVPTAAAAVTVAASHPKGKDASLSSSLALNQPQIVVRLYVRSPSSDPAADSNTTQDTQRQQEVTAMEAIMSDGACQMPVLVLHTESTLALFDSHRREGFNDFIILVEGFVTTEYYAGISKARKFKIKPCLCLASFKVLQRNKLTRPPPDLGKPLEEVLSTGQGAIRAAVNAAGADNHNNSHYNKTSDAQSPSSSLNSVLLPQSLVHRGTAGSFLKQRAPFLTNEELAGDGAVPLSRWVEMGETCATGAVVLEAHQDNLFRVSNFLAQHVAMMTLQSAAAVTVSSSSSGRSTPTASNTSATDSAEACTHVADQSESSSTTAISTSGSRPTDQTVINYTAALKEFSSSQFDRQRASLVSNSGREPADRASLVLERYMATLECALNDEAATSLTIPLLCSWHAMLLQGLHHDAGKIRVKAVRAGNTYFAAPDKIKRELEDLCHSLESLQARLSLSTSSKSSISDTKHAIAYVAGAMFGVVDIHPFSDGNGRLSRIVANWALKRVAKVPFPVNLFATPAQRADYMVALQQTQCCFSLRPWGSASRDEVVQAIKCTGVLLPIVRLLMDRLARASDECLRVWEEKSVLATEAAEARVSRRARERAAQGTCLICFDERPNIATLCCGKAMHLNCIAEWLGNNGNCPVCRSELPSISGRVVRAVSSGAAAGGGEAALTRRRRIPFRLTDEDFEDEEDTEEGVTAEDASDDEQGDDDDELESTTESTTSATSNEDGEDPIRALAAQLQRQIERQRGVDVGREASLEIARRLLSAVSPASANEDHDTTEDTSSSQDDDDDDDDDETMDADQLARHARALRRDNHNSEDETTEDADMTEDVQQQDDADEEDSSTTEEQQDSSPPVAARYCAADHCRNRPAADCSNLLCGRCCVLTGTYFCARHNF